LKWFTIVVDGVAMYGEIQDSAVVDGLIRTIDFSLNQDGSVTALLPHFWTDAEVDPSYSVLLGEYTNPCGDSDGSLSTRDKHIVIGVVVGVVGAAGLIAVVIPRLTLLRQIRRGEKRQGANVPLETIPSHTTI